MRLGLQSNGRVLQMTEERKLDFADRPATVLNFYPHKYRRSRYVSSTAKHALLSSRSYPLTLRAQETYCREWTARRASRGDVNTVTSLARRASIITHDAKRRLQGPYNKRAPDGSS